MKPARQPIVNIVSKCRRLGKGAQGQVYDCTDSIVKTREEDAPSETTEHELFIVDAIIGKYLSEKVSSSEEIVKYDNICLGRSKREVDYIFMPKETHQYLTPEILRQSMNSFSQGEKSKDIFTGTEQKGSENYKEKLEAHNSDDNVMAWTCQQKGQYLEEISKGVKILHDNNVIHGDLKPDNVLTWIDGKGNVKTKIIDYGLSCYTGSKPGQTDILSQLPKIGFCKNAALAGSIAYMAKGIGTSDKKRDFFSLLMMAAHPLNLIRLPEPLWTKWKRSFKQISGKPALTIQQVTGGYSFTSLVQDLPECGTARAQVETIIQQLKSSD